jgi:hypothetical protein
MPSIGLRPRQARLSHPPDWIKKEAASVARAFNQRMREAWFTKFCENAAKPAKGQAELAEAVHRCSRLVSPKTPPFVDQWYETQLGLKFASAKPLLKL